MLNFIIFVQ